jgi:2'-5' RNA ligase
MPRLFIAIELPTDIKDRLLALKTDIPTARWLKAQQMHLTMRFIGEVSDKQTNEITSALQKIESAAFDMSLNGVGRFPAQKKRSTRILWVGVDAGPQLENLHGKIEMALDEIGFPPDKKRFNPHITLARLKANKTPAQAVGFLADNADFNAGTFAVARFVLVKSTLSSQGAKYSNLAEYQLT